MNKTIEISGMNCGKCANRVKEALMAKCQVTDIRVEIPYAYITLKKDVDNKILVDAVENAGYDVVRIEEYFIPNN